MRKGERTRAAVVGKAAAVFNEKGYARTTVGDLVARTGLERGGLYNHFDGKEALALAAFDHAAALVRARVEAAMAAAGERAPDRLDALVGVFAGLVDDPPLPGGCPILNAAVESDGTFPALRERARLAMDQWARALAGTAKRGVAAGELRADLDHRRLATVVISTLEGAVMLSRLYDDPARMRVAADHVRTWLREQAT
jgi:AcrR family transcriptional regulator